MGDIMHYKIVKLKNPFLQTVYTYPCLVELLYLKQNNHFETKQVEHLFEPMNDGKKRLLEHIQQREDYSYYHGVHRIINPITQETISIIMNEFDIEVEEDHENHVIFDIMKALSQNFYMIKA